MSIKFDTTSRGFSYGVFTDLYGSEISIQDSSLATEPAIWLGPEDAEPQRLIPGRGWTPVEFPPDTLFTTRMHINKEQALELIDVLKRFVDTDSVNPEKTK